MRAEPVLPQTPVKTGWKCIDDRTLTADMLRGDKEAQEAFINALTPAELDALPFDWGFWARDDQLPPRDWITGEKYIWCLRCGRGWGKTRTAGQAIIEAVRTGKYKHLSLCGATAEEVRDIMINGESGLARYCPPNLGMVYKPSIKKVFFSNGAVISIFYGSEPEKSRGAQSDWLWCDEIHKWQYPEETFDNLLLGLRLGSNPLCVVTSTPKPTAFTKRLEGLTTSDGKPCVHVTVGSTYENKSNLSPAFISTIVSKYEGTRLGQQELYAQILDDNPNALFKKDWIENNKVDSLPLVANRYRIVVSVDPAASHTVDSNHTGIITVLEGAAPERLISAATIQHKNESHYYVLADASLIGTPHQWGVTVKAMAETHKADTVVIEDNQGGDMVESTLINAGVTQRIHRVRAVHSKLARALNSSTLCEQGRIHFYRNPLSYHAEHGTDPLDMLEEELCNWQPGDDSPDRMDAFVHAINYLKPDLKDLAHEDAAKRALFNIAGGGL